MNILSPFLALALLGADPTVTQTACTRVEGKTVEAAKQEVLLEARRGAVEQLFGSFVLSVSKSENLELRQDDIQAASMGYLRLAGEPTFYNGQGLGEICARISGYATEEDLEKLKPKPLTRKSCLAEGDVREIRDKAKRRAIGEALTDFDGRLRRYDADRILPLLHEVRVGEEAFVPGTQTFCASVAGLAYPLEVEAFLHADSGLDRGPEVQVRKGGPGLQGEYFNLRPFDLGGRPAFPVQPVTTRIDRSIEFEWEQGAPASRASDDFFGVRWRGQIRASTSGSYAFKLVYRGGVHLKVGDKSVVEDFSFEEPTEYGQRRSAVGNLVLEAGRWYPIEVEYVAETGEAFIHLLWRPPDAERFKIVPAETMRSGS